MKRQLLSASVAAAFVLIVACAAMAQEQSGARTARAILNSYQENITLSTTGVGELTLKLNDDTMTIDYVLTYSGLEGGAATAAHIHVGTRHVNGGVAAFLCGGGDKPPCPATAGTVEGTIDPADIIGPAGQGLPAGAFEEFVGLIRRGVTYVNVHTPTWPGGEIRGQIQDLDQRIQ